MELKELCKKINEYRGIDRKRGLGAALEVLHPPPGGPEDAGIVEHRDEVLLMAADGIIPEMVEADPWWAGFCSVLVNLHDISAMGGDTLALVDILTSTDTGTRDEIMRGMNDASELFGVPFVSGHLHPDAPYNAVDVMALGYTSRDMVVKSGTARPGDLLIYAVAPDGKARPKSPYSWDSVSRKKAEVLRRQLGFVPALARRHLVTAAKDVSNPGMVGTLGMMLESKKLGAVVRLEDVPNPNMPYYPWLLMYPGMGFLVACDPKNEKGVLKVSNEHLLSARKIGEINDSKAVELELRDERCRVFDWEKNGLTGMW